jgi:O-methyltransferase involved in polyketide biosynthesis
MTGSKNTRDEYYNQIIPTAWLTAYRRAFSDIAFSKEILSELDKLLKKHKFPIKEGMKAPQISPQMEARHKIVSKLIKKENPVQILEIAAGFSSRGMEFCRNSQITYVELDLPLVIKEKRQIINSIIKKEISNLHLVPGNALDYKSLVPALKYFDKKKPLIIVNEGLLRYMNFKEKTKIARNVEKILKRFNGVWITPDITLRGILFNEDKNVKEHNKLIQSMTKINTNNNRFDNENQARKFFGDLGFSIEKHSFLEVVNELKSPKVLKIPKAVVREMNSFPTAYVMRLKTKP